jgi:hypothetical protein
MLRLYTYMQLSAYQVVNTAHLNQRGAGTHTLYTHCILWYAQQLTSLLLAFFKYEGDTPAAASTQRATGYASG